MRVLFLSVSGRLGGAERVLLDVVASIGAQQPSWRLAAISFEDGPLIAQLAAHGVDVEVLPLPRRFAALGESGHAPLSTAARLVAASTGIRTYARTLGAAVNRLNPDIVHSNGLKSHVLSAWTVRPPRALIWHMHDYVAARRVSSWLLRANARRPAAIVANSRTVGDDVRQAAGAGASVHTIYNGVDTARFRPEGPRLDLDAASGLPAAPPGTTRIGLVATYARWKGHDVFLRALARLPASLNVRGYIVGGPVYQTAGSQRSRAELESLAGALGLDGRVGFVGFQQDTAPVYRHLDIAVHASTEPEPFGLAIVEAMACGRPIVISGAGGASEIARECAGMPVYPPGDDAQLAERLADLCADGRHRTGLGEEGRATVLRRFSRDRMGAEIVALYRRLVDTAAPAHAR